MQKGGVKVSHRRNSKLSVISSSKKGRKRGSEGVGAGLDMLSCSDEAGKVYLFCLSEILSRHGIKPVLRAEYRKEGYTSQKHARLEGNGVFSTEEELTRLLQARIAERKLQDVDKFHQHLHLSSIRESRRKVFAAESRDSLASPGSGSNSSAVATR